jgi:glycosyltransferase involved in cell wall biosynthesis
MHRSIIPVGQISKERLARLYREALAVIVPSRAEGFCLPVLEAHASGACVISTPVPAVKEILTDSDIVCAGYSSTDIAAGIIRFFTNSRVLREYSQKAASGWAEKYSRSEIARRVLSVYGAAVRAGAKR